MRSFNTLFATKAPPAPPMTGLTDAVLAGWFNNQTGELFTGFPVGPDDVVADIGCGLGKQAVFCARFGARLILVDIDAERVARARAGLEAIAGHAPFESHVSGGNPLPIENETATRVICTEVIEHVESPETLLAEIYRIARPGALIMLSCPDPGSEAVQRRLAPPVYFQPPGHVRVLGRDEFAGLVGSAGLEIVARHQLGFFWTIWLAFFWTSGSSLGAAGENSFDVAGVPLLDHWRETWQLLLEQPDGLRVKRALDAALPNSQLIIARKP